ncbi:MAG: carboxymuconolactone decarboxylase family protein [Hyphomicrobiaceae bacterium]
MRFPPIAREQWSESQRRVAEEIVSGPRGELRGPFVPLLHSPELAGHVQKLGGHIRFGTGIPDNLIEIAVLMTARRFDCAQIWVSHRVLAAKAGVRDAVILAIRDRRRPAALSEGEAIVFNFCEELARDNAVSDATFERAVGRLGRKGAIELAAACGYYALLAQVLNVAQPPLPPETRPFGV